MKKKFFLLFTFLLLTNISLFAKNPNILIINSYHRGFEWSDKIINGMEKVFYGTKINANVLYMDSKRIASPKYYKELKELYLVQLEKSKYDLVVAIDKFAYEFVLQNYKELFTTEPVYFIGIEQYSKQEVQKYNLEDKVSGLLERRAIEEMTTYIYKMIPKLEKLYIINDASKNGDDSDPFITNAIKNLNKNIEVEYIRESTIDDLTKKFSVYKKNEAIFFIRFYNDKYGELYKNSEIATMIDNCKIPVFSTDTLFINKGSVGGKLVDINSLGKSAGKDILDILNKKLKTPFTRIHEDYDFIFDYQKCKEFGIKPELLKEKFIYINAPKSFFEKYRKFIDTVFVVSPFLVLLILGLIHNLFLRIQKSKISQQRIQLDKILLNAIDSPIVWQDNYGNIVEYNTKFKEFMGFLSKCKKTTFSECMQYYKNIPIKQTLEPFFDESLGENQLVIKDNRGKERSYLINQENYVEDIYKTRGTVTVLTDITKEKQAIKERAKNQEFIIQQSKLAEIGEIFSSIAHQWKSPLVEIATIAQEQLYNKEGEIDEVNSKYVNDIMFQVKYMTETINSFQKFIMPSTKKSIFDISESVHEMLEIIRHNMKYNYITVKVEVKPNTNLMILGYKNELMQTLLNIVNNAKDAIIKLKSKEDSRKGIININIENVDNLVQIEIQDNGGGIPQKHINKVFNPYFTTKKNGHGIGLYMAKVIIEDKMGGKIKASNANDGAILTIQLETYNENTSFRR
ncbi:ATP-binding protein [Halarcobacter ebronensis]|uniref:histidine kinase n=1 Tax=Halarcobacter ebronensis TaxID=1462615 RepID=A0A4Q0YE64_9BACT|nr:HAMP domain-containing sensor histidine kinase [Halarcobacter ebronensis]RXJ67894.1 ATP-binding protein [Halarcobacter ebronensis]